MSRKMVLLVASIVAVVLGAAATALGASPSHNNDSAKGNSAKTNKDFSGLVDIGGGRKMYMECQGKGSPTVVLVSGLGNAADIWTGVIDSGGVPKPSRAAVFPQVAKFTRVCAYDRPRTIRVTDDDKPSRSTPVEQPTSAKPAAADLDALLGASGEPPPYVLVGHSFGGAIIRLYAGAHPAEVGGLVFVDALSEDVPNGLTPRQQALFEKINTPPPGSHGEAFDASATFRQMRESPPAPTVPTVVLTADRPQLTESVAKEALDLPAGVAQEFANDFWASQLAAQEKLAKRFPGAEHITDTNSSHYIQAENPRLVIDSIRSVVDAERDGAKRQSRGAEVFGSATPSATPSATATVSATSSAGAGGAAQYQYASALPGSGGVSPVLLLAVIPAILLVVVGLLSARLIRIG